MKIIDGHMHLHGNAGRWFVDCAAARGYSAYAVLSLSCMKAYDGEENNWQCLRVKQTDPEHAYFFAGLSYPCDDPLAHVRTWLDRGADGIKLIETKPTTYNETGVDLSDLKFDPMFAFLEESGTPILWHVGDPATFWKRDEAPDFAFENGWFYGDGGFPTLEELYAIPETVLSRHPRLKIAFAHLYFCGDDPAHLQRLLDNYENVRVDITPGTEMYDHFDADRAGWRAFFVRNQDRIQLGTDTEMGDAFENSFPLGLALRALGADGLNLPEDVAEKVAYSNFIAFAGPSPKPLPAR